MNLKQIEGIGLNILSVFVVSFLGAIYSAVTNGIPHDWPGARKLLGTASLSGLIAVFGWIKMKSPWAHPAPVIIGQSIKLPPSIETGGTV